MERFSSLGLFNLLEILLISISITLGSKYWSDCDNFKTEPRLKLSFNSMGSALAQKSLACVHSRPYQNFIFAKIPQIVESLRVKSH